MHRRILLFVYLVRCFHFIPNIKVNFRLKLMIVGLWSARVISGKMKPSSQGSFQLRSMQTRNRAVHHSCLLLLQLHVELKEVYLPQGYMNYCFPNCSVMGPALFEIFCKGKILNTFGIFTHFFTNLFFTTKKVANSVIWAKTAKHAMLSSHEPNYWDQWAPPYSTQTLLLSNSRASPPNRLNFVSSSPLMNCAVHTKRVLSSYSNRSWCQLLMDLFHDPLIKYSRCNLVMPCTSDSGHTS